MSETLAPPQWQHSTGLVDYPLALSVMEARVAALRAGSARELVWLLEHPALYTAGTSAKPADLLSPRFPVHQAGRGGQYTYHGPGQRVVYLMLNLAQRRPDLRHFVHTLEQWVIDTLALLGVVGERRPGRIGIWVVRAGREDKIAAIGIRVRHWISFHGLAVNVAPDLGHFSGIVPCGIHDHGVTSLHDLGVTVSLADVDRLLAHTWPSVLSRLCAKS